MIDENKMYAVVAVLLIILLGLFVYLISIDLKLRRLEKRHRETGIENETAIAAKSKNEQ